MLKKWLKRKYPNINFTQKEDWELEEPNTIDIEGSGWDKGITKVRVYGNKQTLNIEVNRKNVSGFTNGNGDVIEQLIKSKKI